MYTTSILRILLYTQQKEFSVFFLSPVLYRALHIKDTQKKLLINLTS